MTKKGPLSDEERYILTPKGAMGPVAYGALISYMTRLGKNGIVLEGDTLAWAQLELVTEEQSQ